MSYLKLFCGRKLLVPQQVEQLMLGTDLVRLILIRTGTKDGNKVLKFPRLDIVIYCVPPVNVSLDGVTLVANHEANSKSASISKGDDVE